MDFDALKHVGSFMSITSKGSKNISTYKSCSKQAFQITLDASCLEQKFDDSAKTKHKVDAMQEDEQRQAVPQLEWQEHLELEQDQPVSHKITIPYHLYIYVSPACIM